MLVGVVTGTLAGWLAAIYSLSTLFYLSRAAAYIAGDGHHSAINSKNRRRLACRIRIVYGTGRGGLHATSMSVITHCAEACAPLKE